MGKMLKNIAFGIIIKTFGKFNFTVFICGFAFYKVIVAIGIDAFINKLFLTITRLGNFMVLSIILLFILNFYMIYA